MLIPSVWFYTKLCNLLKFKYKLLITFLFVDFSSSEGREKTVTGVMDYLWVIFRYRLIPSEAVISVAIYVK